MEGNWTVGHRHTHRHKQTRVGGHVRGGDSGTERGGQARKEAKTRGVEEGEKSERETSARKPSSTSPSSPALLSEDGDRALTTTWLPSAGFLSKRSCTSYPHQLLLLPCARLSPHRLCSLPLAAPSPVLFDRLQGRQPMHLAASFSSSMVCTTEESERVPGLFMVLRVEAAGVDNILCGVATFRVHDVRPSFPKLPSSNSGDPCETSAIPRRMFCANNPTSSITALLLFSPSSLCVNDAWCDSGGLSGFKGHGGGPACMSVGGERTCTFSF